MKMFIVGAIAGILMVGLCALFPPVRWLVAVCVGLWLLRRSTHLWADDELPPPV